MIPRAELHIDAAEGLSLILLRGSLPLLARQPGRVEPRAYAAPAHLRRTRERCALSLTIIAPPKLPPTC